MLVLLLCAPLCALLCAAAPTDELEAFSPGSVAPATPPNSTAASPSPSASGDSAPAHSLPPLALTAARRERLEAEGIVPGVLSAAPSSLTKLSWLSNSVRLADLGASVAPTAALLPPRVNYNVRANKFHSLALLDIDAPSRDDPVAAQWMHWVVVNIPGRDLARGQTLVEYVGPSPSEGSGPHRYVFVVYEQSGKVDTEHAVKISNTAASGRAKWNIERYMAVSDPAAKLVSANFFLSEFDDSVPATQEQLVD